MPIFYLAWVDEGIAFNPAVHATVTQKVWDGTDGGEIVFSLAIDHAEGDFPGLKAELINPRIGLLSADRNQWVWLSADFGDGAEALFNGRIIGVPQRLADEIIEVEFIARPADFVEQKEALAVALRVLPWFDPVWLQEGLDDPDTVLETRAARWHIDRVTLAVTSSNIIAGEDGTIDVTEANHFYDNMSVSYGPAPLREVTVTGTITYTQEGTGRLDLNRRFSQMFQTGGSPIVAPFIASLTGKGLLDDWPKPGASIGAGWSMALDSALVEATWIRPVEKAVTYLKPNELTVVPATRPIRMSPATALPTEWTVGETFVRPNLEEQLPLLASRPPALLGQEFRAARQLLAGFSQWSVIFELGVYQPNFMLAWEAARPRTEVVTFTLRANVQSIVVDPGGADAEIVTLASDFVDQPIDPGGVMPIGDLRRNCYFKTVRGQVSFEYLLALPRAMLMSRARAVIIKFQMPWGPLALGLSCRKSILLHDYRLPGGQATGKITAYKLVADGDSGASYAEVTIGCTVGYGVALAAADAGTPVYVVDGVLEDGIQQRIGGTVSLLPGELQYQSFDDLDVVDDDGVDLLNMTATNALLELSMTGGVNDQRAVIEHPQNLGSGNDPVTALKATPTKVTLRLKPLNRSFSTTFTPVVYELVVPQTINLEST